MSVFHTLPARHSALDGYFLKNFLLLLQDARLAPSNEIGHYCNCGEAHHAKYRSHLVHGVGIRSCPNLVDNYIVHRPSTAHSIAEKILRQVLVELQKINVLHQKISDLLMPSHHEQTLLPHNHPVTLACDCNSKQFDWGFSPTKTAGRRPTPMFRRDLVFLLLLLLIELISHKIHHIPVIIILESPGHYHLPLGKCSKTNWNTFHNDLADRPLPVRSRPRPVRVLFLINSKRGFFRFSIAKSIITQSNPHSACSTNTSSHRRIVFVPGSHFPLDAAVKENKEESSSQKRSQADLNISNGAIMSVISVISGCRRPWHITSNQSFKRALFESINFMISPTQLVKARWSKGPIDAIKVRRLWIERLEKVISVCLIVCPQHISRINRNNEFDGLQVRCGVVGFVRTATISLVSDREMLIYLFGMNVSKSGCLQNISRVGCQSGVGLWVLAESVKPGDVNIFVRYECQYVGLSAEHLKDGLQVQCGVVGFGRGDVNIFVRYECQYVGLSAEHLKDGLQVQCGVVGFVRGDVNIFVRYECQYVGLSAEHLKDGLQVQCGVVGFGRGDVNIFVRYECQYVGLSAEHLKDGLQVQCGVVGFGRGDVNIFVRYECQYVGLSAEHLKDGLQVQCGVVGFVRGDVNIFVRYECQYVGLSAEHLKDGLQVRCGVVGFGRGDVNIFVRYECQYVGLSAEHLKDGLQVQCGVVGFGRGDVNIFVRYECQYVGLSAEHLKDGLHVRCRVVGFCRGDVNIFVRYECQYVGLSAEHLKDGLHVRCGVVGFGRGDVNIFFRYECQYVGLTAEHLKDGLQVQCGVVGFGRTATISLVSDREMLIYLFGMNVSTSGCLQNISRMGCKSSVGLWVLVESGDVNIFVRYECQYVGLSAEHLKDGLQVQCGVVGFGRTATISLVSDREMLIYLFGMNVSTSGCLQNISRMGCISGLGMWVLVESVKPGDVNIFVRYECQYVGLSAEHLKDVLHVRCGVVGFGRGDVNIFVRYECQYVGLSAEHLKDGLHVRCRVVGFGRYVGLSAEHLKDGLQVQCGVVGFGRVSEAC
ncbi:hypothetical protein J6590_096809 [Homalodisca vitripennis]|nr:hypothetical protein J6590_096809 [Homalodisca vitripennis]